LEEEEESISETMLAVQVSYPLDIKNYRAPLITECAMIRLKDLQAN
jgi:hypothetical protein